MVVLEITASRNNSDGKTNEYEVEEVTSFSKGGDGLGVNLFSSLPWEIGQTMALTKKID